MARHACLCLKHLAPALMKGPAAASPALLTKAYSALSRVLLVAQMPENDWYTAAEVAIGALYALHPRPNNIMQVWYPDCNVSLPIFLALTHVK